MKHVVAIHCVCKVELRSLNDLNPKHTGSIFRLALWTTFTIALDTASTKLLTPVIKEIPDVVETVS